MSQTRIVDDFANLPTLLSVFQSVYSTMTGEIPLNVHNDEVQLNSTFFPKCTLRDAEKNDTEKVIEMYDLLSHFENIAFWAYLLFTIALVGHYMFSVQEPDANKAIQGRKNYSNALMCLHACMVVMFIIMIAHVTSNVLYGSWCLAFVIIAELFIISAYKKIKITSTTDKAVIKRMQDLMTQKRIRSSYLAVVYHAISFMFVKDFARAGVCSSMVFPFERFIWYAINVVIWDVLEGLNETEDLRRKQYDYEPP